MKCKRDDNQRSKRDKINFPGTKVHSIGDVLYLGQIIFIYLVKNNVYNGCSIVGIGYVHEVEVVQG